MDWSEAEKVADVLLADYKDDYEYSPDIVRFVGKYGFQVGTSTVTDIDGFLVRQRDRRVIGVRETLSLSLKRYVIAYAFARYILRDGKQKDVAVERYRLGDMAPDADKVALSVLLPLERFAASYREVCITGCEGALAMVLAKRFRVTAECVRRRAEG